MQTVIKNQANNTIANLGASVEMLPANEKITATRLEATLVKADKLRTSADESFKQYVIAGRDALLAIMGDVYALYCDIKQDAVECKKVIAHMTPTVATLSQVRATSSDASVLVRYICREMSDKKVSVYSRCIALAHNNKIASGGLVALVKSTPDGWQGVLNKFAPTKTTGVVSIAADSAATAVRQEPTVQTISAADWNNNETVRVFIATYNDDGTADIKNACLTADSVDIVLKRYLTDKKQREKPTKDSEAAILEKVVAVLVGNVANAETKVGNIRAELNVAITKKQDERAANLQVNLRVAEGELKTSSATLKSERNTLAKLIEA